MTHTSQALSSLAPPMVAALSEVGVFQNLNSMTPEEAVAFATRIESLGYGAVWVPEGFGHESFTTLAYLAAHTERLGLATAIANIWLRSAGTVAQATRTVSEQSQGRFALGLGVGHRGTMIDVRRLSYDKPLTRMREYLTEMDEALWIGPEVETSAPRLLAALGPKMLELAGSHADGAVPYLTTPEHTATARAILGPDKLLCVEQKVIVSTNGAAARAAIGRALDVYGDPTNYRNNWLRLGFSASDIDDRSNRFLDALVPWGPASAALERVREHYEAGADHVCIQVEPTDGSDIDWNTFEELAPQRSVAAG